MSNQTTEPSTTGSSETSASEKITEVSSAAASAAGSVGGTAKDEAASVASSAAEQAKDVAAQAKEQARGVALSAGDSARNALQQTTSELRTQADDRARQAAGGLRSTSQQLSALAEGRPDEAGPIGDYVRDAAERLSQLAGRLEEGGLEAAMRDVARFARRRPGVFLAGAAAAGFFMGRFIRNQGGDDGAAQATADTEISLVGATSPSALPAATAPSPAERPTVAPQTEQMASGATRPAVP